MIKGMKWGGMLFASLLMASSCQNEEIVSDIQSGNYTLNVSSFVGSRTHVEQDGTVKWSKGDKLYVYGQGVSGVLTLDDNDADKTDGKFSGFVFGNPQNLKWAVFGDNVKFTNDGAQFTIKEVTDPNSNSPMVGEIGNGNVQMEHLCGMVRLTINNLPQNATVTLGGTGIAGTAEVKNGKITNIASEHSISLKTVNGTDNVFEIPVFASEEETPVEFTLTIDGVSTSFKAPIKVKSLSQDAIKTFNCAVDATTGKVTDFAFAVGTEAALHNALSEGGNIALSNDITLTNKWAGTVEKFIGTLNGNGYTIKGIADANADEIYSIKDLIADTSKAKLKNVNFEFADESSHSYSEDASYELKSNSVGESTLSLVNGDFTGETFNVPEGVTHIGGYAFAYNNIIKTITLPSTVTNLNDRAFRDTKASNIILNEGLTNISYQAFRNATNVKEVVIPSTVTVINKEAFQNSGIITLAIPSSVTTLEYGACRDMKELETVTIEGNVDIPVYAFRACTKLKTVILKGDDVKFGNGMIFTNKENGDGSAITVYVANETVKERLLAADTASKNKIVVATAVGSVEELATALNSKKNILLTNNVEYTESITLADGVNFDGNGKTVTFVGTDSDDHLVKLGTGAKLNNVTLNNYRVRTEETTAGNVTMADVVINMDNNLTGLDISRGFGTAILTSVKCKSIKDDAHLNPETQVQVDYTPYGDVLLGTNWGLEATDCEFGSLHGWNTTNGSNVSLNNTTYTVFRMHYWNNRTLYIDGVETAWSESGAIPVAHDVGGCWSVQPAFK